MTKVETEQDVERILQLLRIKMKEKGFTQVAVQKVTGWRGSYISQILNRTKALRVEQLLQILSVIGIPPVEFFLEIYETKPGIIDRKNELIGQLKGDLESIARTFELLFLAQINYQREKMKP